ncbi:MAG: hypothetical protein ABEI74_03600 [Candidatus Pacearchaeota archaeon]
MLDRNLKKKNGQESMIGFGIIIVLVSVILLVFLWFSSTQQGEQNLDDSEINNFLTSYTQYVSNCSSEFGTGKRSIRDLTTSCNPEDNEANACGSMNVCQKLNSTSKKLLNESWQVGPNRPQRGYELIITRSEEDSDAAPEKITNITAGNLSSSTYRGASRSFSQSGYEYDVVMRVYS